MKRKLIDSFDRLEYKAPRLELTSAALPIPAVPQHSQSHQPMPTDVDLHNVMRNFVNIYEKLDPSDELLVKPNYSYTELVYLAVLRSPNYCLPIGEIYSYVQNRFAFFRNNTRLHWRNAIRHSLSKTKCFTKISLGRGASGSSNRSCFLWSILPSSIINFARGDYRPNVDRDSGTNTLRWGYYHTNAGNFWDQVCVVLENKIESFKVFASTSSSPTKVFQQQLCDLPHQTTGNSTTTVPQTTSYQATAPVVSDCQSPVLNTPSATSLQSTPPPNVVCQPDGAIYANNVKSEAYTSSTPIAYNVQPVSFDVSPHTSQLLTDNSLYSSPSINACSRLSPESCSTSTPSTSLSYDACSSYYQTVSPAPSTSCMQSAVSNDVSTDISQLWSQQSPLSSSSCQTSFEKDSGIELSVADLESLREAIHDWTPIYQTDSNPVFLASGTQIDTTPILPSSRTVQSSTEESPVFPEYVPDNRPLDLSANTHTSESSAPMNVYGQYQAYSHTTYPEYNFHAQVRSHPNQLYAFNAGLNSYQPMQWYQN